MITLKHGGPAFPQHGWSKDPEIHQRMQDQGGMSLRDYFASQCCAAMVSTIRDDRDYARLRQIAEAHDLDSVSQFFAREAYKQADAMLAERAK